MLGLVLLTFAVRELQLKPSTSPDPADDTAKLVAVLVLFLFTALPALLPLGARAVAPGPSQRVLTRLGTFMTVHKRGVTATVSTVFGAYLLVRGLGKL